MAGLEVGSYQLDKQITVSPRESIRATYPLPTLCPHIWRKAVHSYICIGEASPDMALKEHWIINFRPCSF